MRKLLMLALTMLLTLATYAPAALAQEEDPYYWVEEVDPYEQAVEQYVMECVFAPAFGVPGCGEAAPEDPGAAVDDAAGTDQAVPANDTWIYYPGGPTPEGDYLPSDATLPPAEANYWVGFPGVADNLPA